VYFDHLLEPLKCVLNLLFYSRVAFNGSHNVYCVSDYCQRLWHMYSSIRSESRRPPEIRSERWDLLIFIFILKTTGTFTPVHSAGYLILLNEIRSTQEVARQNIQVSVYIRSTGLWPNTWIHVSQSLAIIRNAIHIVWPVKRSRILLNCRTPPWSASVH
jgi:hypothetical protein